MAYLIPVEGEITEVHPTNPKKGFELDQLYTLLACRTIEVVRLPDDKRILIIDEEGKLTGKLRNPRATQMVQFPMPDELAEMKRILGDILILANPELLEEPDFIVGTALVCKNRELK